MVSCRHINSVGLIVEHDQLHNYMPNSSRSAIDLSKMTEAIRLMTPRTNPSAMPSVRVYKMWRYVSRR